MKMTVEFLGKSKFKNIIGEHEVLMDLPISKGGEGKAPSPSEYFVASLASCIGLCVSRYLETAKMNSEGLKLEIDASVDAEGKRFERINVNVNIPNADLGKRKSAVINAAKKCFIHNTIRGPLEIEVDVR